MSKANATLADWDGKISVLERQDFSSLCSENLNNHDDITNDMMNVIDVIPKTTQFIRNVPVSEANSLEEQQSCNRIRSSSISRVNENDKDIKVFERISQSAIGNNESNDDTSRPASSRFGSIDHQVIGSSSMLADSITEIMIDDYQNDHEPTSAILDYCKRKVLRPYVAILSVVGLNPISTDTTRCRAFLSFLQCLILVTTLIFGYFLQYLSSYRGDRGFSTSRKHFEQAIESENTSTRTIGELLFGHIIPCLLDLAGYISAVVICKLIDHEQLQYLIERTFLISMEPKKLYRNIWMYIAVSLVLCCCLYVYFVPVILLHSSVIHIKWFGDLETEYQLPVKIALIATLSIQDLIEIIILGSYCIECYLLRVHLTTLSQKLMLYSIDSLDWMRETLQFQKLLERLNNHVSLPVSFLVVMNLTYAFAGFVYMFKDFDFHYTDMKTVILNFLNVLLWLILGLLPFFTAASVTEACQAVRSNGHQIRVKPFVYHNSSAEDLNSLLIFSSSLDMSAKLFRMPIQSNYICFAILVISVVILTTGMCFNLNVFSVFEL